MKTPKEYSNSLSKNVITKKMLAECIFSVNKRAKNMRDKIFETKNSRYYNENYLQKYIDAKDKYYGIKEELLSSIEPVAIHRQNIGYKTVKVTEYDDNYTQLRKENKHRIVHSSRYYDDENDCPVNFFVYETETINYLYFLYYELAGYKFHKPIKTPTSFRHLNIVDIEDDFSTTGTDTNNLLSVQFVNKVLEMIRSGEYTLVDNVDIQ